MGSIFDCELLQRFVFVSVDSTEKSIILFDPKPQTFTKDCLVSKMGHREDLLLQIGEFEFTAHINRPDE